MKIYQFIITFVLLSEGFSDAQFNNNAKIYIYQSRGTKNISDFKTTLNPDLPIQMSDGLKDGYALVETNADSIGLPLRNKKTVFLHFKAGESSFFRITSSTVNSSGLSNPVINRVDEQEFWLNVYFNQARYRHYFLGKEMSLNLLEDSN